MASKKRGSSLVTLTPPRLTRAAAVQNQSPARLVKVARRSARYNGPITCCEFGRDRLEKYPLAEFCHPCKMWDDRDVLNNKLSRTMAKYTCKMNHVSLHEPQSQVKHWWDSRDKFATKELVVRSPIRSPRRSLKKSFHRKWRKVILEQCKSAAAKVSENYENAIRKQEEIRQKYLRSLEKVKSTPMRPST